MKHYYVLCIALLLNFSATSQSNNEIIIVLKGGISVLEFSNNIINYSLANKNDYNITIDEKTSIRLWAKNGVSNPHTTKLTLTEGNRNHTYTIQYQEKGDFNSTFYDFTAPQQRKPSEPIVVVNRTEAKKEEAKIQQQQVTTKKYRNEDFEKNLAQKRKDDLSQQLAKERSERDALQKRIDEERQLQERIDTKLAVEKKKNEEHAKQLEQERKERMLLEQKLASEKKQNELKQKIEAEKKRQEEIAAQLAIERKTKEEKNKQALEEKRIQDELNQKLLAERKQRESLEKQLNEQRAKRELNEKLLTLEMQKREQYEKQLMKEKETKVALTTNELKKESTLSKPKFKLTEETKTSKNLENNSATKKNSITNIDNFVATNAENFPTINFNEPPVGQYFDAKHFGDTSLFYKNSQTFLKQTEDSKFKNAGTEMDNIRIQLCNINYANDAVYVRFRIENKTNGFFLLGATMLKILEAESGKKHQLNPMYISSFPIMESNSSAYIVYVMNAESNISPDSFVLMSIKERRTGKKVELNFPGNFYTDVLKK